MYNKQVHSFLNFEMIPLAELVVVVRRPLLRTVATVIRGYNYNNKGIIYYRGIFFPFPFSLESLIIIINNARCSEIVLYDV